MDDHSSSSSSNHLRQSGGPGSPYMFRPILDNKDEVVFGHHTAASSRISSPYEAAGGRLSVVNRIRANSGGSANSSSAAAAVSSPTSLTVTRPTPKLINCYRNASQETAWSSQGSRHSSRPGSSASSRPPSQCCGGNNNSSSMYNRSNNSSMSDVSVAKNFKELSVSNKREIFKAQKWPSSLDHGGLTSVTSALSSCGGSAQTSPGRRRQPSLQQKSLDLDSGYQGSSTGDLKSILSTDNSSNVYSPSISDARQELHELMVKGSNAEMSSEATAFMMQKNASLDAAATTSGIPIGDLDDLSRSASLPSFPESFPPASSLQRNIGLPVLESAQDLDADEEIERIVAQGTQQQQQQQQQHDLQSVLSYLDKQCPTSNDSNVIKLEKGGYDSDGICGVKDRYTVDVLIVPSRIRPQAPEPITSVAGDVIATSEATTAASSTSRRGRLVRSQTLPQTETTAEAGKAKEEEAQDAKPGGESTLRCDNGSLDGN